MTNIDYEEQMTQYEEEKQQKLTEAEQMYGGMIDKAQQFYQDQIDESKRWAAQQSALQQEKTDFTIEQIEQQKAQTKKDYTKEQSGAYADWQKESNRYGVNAEEMAAGGLSGTGYGESSQVRMYNTYQNRLATARESYNLAILNYNNAIKEAQIQNNSVLAEIAHAALKEQLELSLQGFQYENQLIFDMENTKAQIEDTYYGRYLDVLDQMNTEKALAEQERQYNMNYDLKLKEYEEGVRQFNEEMERLKQLDAEEKRQFDLAYAESNKSNEIKIKDETTSGTNTSGYTGKFLPTIGSTTESKEIRDFIEKNLASAGKSSNSSAQQKLTNNEKKQGETKTNSEGSRRIGSTQAPIADAGLKAGANLAMELVGNYFAKGAYAVATNYYRGDLNPDAKTYGTFSNGYQPKGISGHGELEKTGETIKLDTQTLYGKKLTVKQNVWEAQDGSKWYWDGRENSYKSLE